MLHLPRLDAANRSQFIRFVLVGLANTTIGVLLFCGLYVVLGNHTWAAFLAAILAVLIGFLLTGHGIFGFVSWRSLVLYVLWYGFLASLNILSVDLGVRWGINPYLSSVLAAPVVVAASFLVNRQVVFRRQKCETV